jgi:hypothetical protein
MNNETENITAVMLRVELPSTILPPVTADLNALFRVLSNAQVLETIHTVKSEGIAHDDRYAGDNTYWVKLGATPEVSEFRERIYFTAEAAQLARNQSAAQEFARRAAAAKQKATPPTATV